MPGPFRLDARFYRALPVDRPGHERIVLDLDPDRTAFVGMHCWNIGCPDGPPVDVNYCVGMGWPDATQEAERIMREVIRPAMDRCREAGVTVCHVETDWMSDQYPDIPSRRKEAPTPDLSPEHRGILERAHGPAYASRSPLASMKRAEVVSPVGSERMFFYTDSLHRWMSDRRITTLLYAGFATDMCVLNAEGGARAMLARGYRCVLLRDATVGVETPESFPERRATRYGIHLFEWQVGYSATSDALARALRGASPCP